MDTIIDGSFDIFKDVGGAASEDDGRQLAVIGVSLEDHNLLGCDFLDTDIIGAAGLVWGWGLELGEDSSADGSCQSPEFELAEDLDAHDLVLLEEVQHDI